MKNGVVGAALATVGLFGSLLAVPMLFAPAANACGGPDVSVTGPAAGFDTWSTVEVKHAIEIVATGKTMGIPPRGWIIALATAMQESHLRNLANDNPAYPLVVEHSLALPHDGVGHDHDSVGLFQQRPLPPEGEGGWGTVAELMNPTISASKFYSALKKVVGWQDMPLTDAAQAVQVSGYGNAYTKWETPANRLAAHILGLSNLDLIGGGPPGAMCGPDDSGAALSADGWALPTAGPVTSGYRTTARPDHNGVDIGAPRNRPIRAATAGTVLYAGCNASTSCDVDGSPAVSGCGWYVEIAHKGGITTRYCHMVRQPTVAAGDIVASGKIIGQVGSSGNSSGPHLHFEVHAGVPAGKTGDPSNAVEPVGFMASRGVTFG